MFSLTRPPSPSREASHNNTTHDEDHLSSALHAALSNFVSGSSHHSADHDMTKEKERPGIEIIVSSDYVALKGTGVDVEPALLSGHVALNLTESTSIKEITLQFRGKVRLPAPLNEPLSLNSSPQTYNICSHEWSFLEGEKRHSHTLKAGRHLFPFQLQLGGSLPSTIATTVHGGANVSYKLRAVAVRPGLAHNMSTTIPISVVRSFAPEALEYQQTLEIENTWPDKLMYSIMIPHKAWAIGDQLTAIVKFSPLAKGVRVLTVLTNINETTKIHCRGGVQEHTRSVVTVKHEIVNGRAVPLIEQHHGMRLPILHSPQGFVHATSQSAPTTPGLSHEDRTLSFGSLAALAGQTQDLTLRQVPSTASSSSSSHDSQSHPMPPLPPLPPLAQLAPPPIAGPSNASTSTSTPASASSPSPSFSISDPSTSTATTPDDVPMSQDDIVTHLTLTLPRSATPTHALEPITISHRIRWSILMSNLDGHTSELRCSLPLHLLDPRLLEEARAHTVATRRLVLGGIDGAQGNDAEDEQDIELPSYPAHVRDRVPDMYISETTTMRVTRPWVSGASPLYDDTSAPGGAGDQDGGVASGSGAASPLVAHPTTSHLPHVPASGGSTPLDWVNSELLSLVGGRQPSRSRGSGGGSGGTNTAGGGGGGSHNSQSPPHSDPVSQAPSRSGSRPQSRLMSRRGSRAPSPERHFGMTSMGGSMYPSHPHTHAHAHPHVHQPHTHAHPHPHPHPHHTHHAHTHETYVHSGQASRAIPSVLSISMRPQTSLTSPGWLSSSRSNSYTNLSALGSVGMTSTTGGVDYFGIGIGSSGHRSPHTGHGPHSRPHTPGPHTHPHGHGHVSPSTITTTSIPDTSLSTESSNALWHRVYTDVPDYGTASRGFIGGVPPLTSMNGLPSYEEAERSGAGAGHGSAGGAGGQSESS